MERNIPMARALARFAWLLLLAAGIAHAERSRGYIVQELPELASFGGSARAINDHGDVAGSSFLDGDLRNLRAEAVVWRRGKPVDVGTGLGTFSQVSAINDEGTMVGQVGVQPFIWQDGRPMALPFAGFVSRINHEGAIAGSFFPSGVFNFGTQHAMFFREGVLHDLGFPPGFRSSAGADINDRGIVVGSAIPNFSSDNHAMMWKDGVAHDLGGLGGHNSFAAFINDRGDIVGTAETADNRAVMVRWHVEGGMEVLGARMAPHGLNERGAIVGNNLDDGKAFLLEDGTLTVLADLPEVKAAGWLSFAPFGINSRGQIAGVAFKPGSNLTVAVLLTPRDD